ncbi:hypothetical protein Y1Q_0000744 [Alligator mississippiensis]|uniref:Uncharacterized protein n=1 Tax=Alligator mississippiensis TaxID=8496 RepID=A0A151MC81_ALLMI|nr:hypothetical protein Y1Q_0000744 [Alligator mississippiensis]
MCTPHLQEYYRLAPNSSDSSGRHQCSELKFGVFNSRGPDRYTTAESSQTANPIGAPTVTSTGGAELMLFHNQWSATSIAIMLEKVHLD